MNKAKKTTAKKTTTKKTTAKRIKKVDTPAGAFLKLAKGMNTSNLSGLRACIETLAQHARIGFTITYRSLGLNGVGLDDKNKETYLKHLNELCASKATTPKDAGKPCDVFASKGGKRITKLGGWKASKDVAIFSLHKNGAVSYKEGRTTVFIPKSYVAKYLEVKTR
jgi:hypothetical protein